MLASRHTLDDARIVHKEASSLRAAGHEVILLFPYNERYEYCRFDGQVLAIGTPPDGRTIHLDCPVVGVPKRGGLAGKWRMYREMSAAAAGLQADVFHAHEPDLALAAAVRAKRLLAGRGRRALVVHDMPEYPPGETVDVLPGWLKPPAHTALIAWDRGMARQVDHFFSANAIVRGYAQVLAPHLGVDVLYNGPPIRLFPQCLPAHWPGTNHPLVLCHEGSLGFERGLREMVEAVDRLRDRVRLRIVGDVFGQEREWLEGEIARRSLDGVISRTGWLSYTQVGEALRQSHVGLILFRQSMVTVLAGPPNKLFNYMNAGLPVLSIGFPEMRRIVREEKCGVLIEDQSVDAIVRGIESLLASPETLSAMGQAGQEAIRERYSWECMEQTLVAAYGDLAARLEKR